MKSDAWLRRREKKATRFPLIRLPIIGVKRRKETARNTVATSNAARCAFLSWKSFSTDISRPKNRVAHCF